ncbi:MAG TPA: c-type cytochrome biogenesis protein CcsB [Actinomycetota bacterium]|nr:c-type cytochrome biogenesis protein CcsB [Actinomycetota bacterium]
MTAVSTEALTQLSNTTFGITLILYLLAAVASFHHLAFHRRGVLTTGRVMGWTGLAVHAASVVSRGLAAGRVPWGNLYEYVTVVGLLVVAAYLFTERVWRTEALGGFVLALVVAGMGGATLIYVPPGPLVPALNSYWLRIHVVMAMIGSALFTLGFVFTVLSLLQVRKERRHAAALTPARAPALVGADGGGERPADYVPAEEPDGSSAPAAPRGRLPSATTLDRLAYRTIVFAFPIWTMAVIFGAIWAEEAWGRYWGWDPKEVWSFITWVVFAAYLHARATVGWRGTRAAVLAIVGFGALVFNLIVVNTVIAGLHSYAG